MKKGTVNKNYFLVPVPVYFELAWFLTQRTFDNTSVLLDGYITYGEIYFLNEYHNFPFACFYKF